jgi:hypothetical protein
MDKGYYLMSSWNFCDNFLWLHKADGYGYFVLDIANEEILRRRPENQIIRENTKEARAWFYE